MATEEDIESLRVLFPAHNVEVIRETLQTCGNIEEAVDALLALSVTDST